MLHATAELVRLLNLYCASIDHAEDVTLAAQVWETSERASLVYLFGQERGRDNIRDNFYGRDMAGKFDKRKLRLTSTPQTDMFDTFALAQFDREFQATARADASHVLFRDRESQL